jgi:mono/diheme cytochrome c family protein
MKARYLFIIILLGLISCKEQAPLPADAPEGEITQANSIDGKALYEQNCLNCHGSLATTYKKDVTPTQILTGINNIVRMQYLVFLSDEQILEISNALSSKNPDNISPKISNAAPSGKYPGATTSLNLAVVTDLASNCYYDSIDVGVDEMNGQLFANADKTSHQKAIILSPGASYKFYIHCVDTLHQNVTKVSQLITFSTDLDAVDSTPPVITSTFPNEPYLGGTERAKFYLNSNESASCRYSTDINSNYDQMNTMDTTGTLGHVQTLNSLVSGNSYTYYVLCADPTGNISAKETLNLSVLANVNGSILYQNHCTSCHGSISNSSKSGASSQEIQDAINDIRTMRVESMLFLSPTQIDAISNAL